MRKDKTLGGWKRNLLIRSKELNLFTESEIIAEAVFMKRTTVSKIKLKHRVGRKFIKFTSRYLYHF